MPFDVTEAVEFVQDIARNEQVRITVTKSVQSGVAVGCAATAGGLLFGPAGIAVGAILAGLFAAAANRGEFLPLPQVIANMSTEQRAALAGRVERIANNLDVTDLAALGLMLTGNHAVRGKVVQELVNYITQEMQLALT